MIQEIKELRVKIDGLAQLTKDIKPINTIFIDIDMIPNSFKDIEHWLEIANKTQPYTFIENNKNKEVSSIEMFPEISKCYDSLILAKAWLGKILGELGTNSPYSNDGNRKTKEDIEPTADSVRILEQEKKYITDKPWNNLNNIEKIDWLREEIKNLINNTKDFSQEETTIELEQRFVYKYLCEARMWLGFELQRIKENE